MKNEAGYIEQGQVFIICWGERRSIERFSKGKQYGQDIRFSSILICLFNVMRNFRDSEFDSFTFHYYYY